MVFTGPQITQFFENPAQMGLSNRTRLQLQNEGVTYSQDLAEWRKDDWDRFAGDDKWDAMIEAAEAYVTTKKWDGTGATTLESHLDRLKASYISWTLLEPLHTSIHDVKIVF